MLRIEENIQAINFCEYYIGNDKTEVKFLLESFVVNDAEADFIIKFNTASKKIKENEELSFVVININQFATLSIFYHECFKYEKKVNVFDTLKFLDTKQIVNNEWITVFFRENTENAEFLLRISVFLSEFNKKQLLDVKLKTLSVIHNRIEQIEIEKYDNPLKKKKKEQEKKKSANPIYTILVQDPSALAPLKKTVVESKTKEISSPKIVLPTNLKNTENGSKTPPEFEFQAKIDCTVH